MTMDHESLWRSDLLKTVAVLFFLSNFWLSVLLTCCWGRSWCHDDIVWVVGAASKLEVVYGPCIILPKRWKSRTETRGDYTEKNFMWKVCFCRKRTLICRSKSLSNKCSVSFLFFVVVVFDYVHFYPHVLLHNYSYVTKVFACISRTSQHIIREISDQCFRQIMIFLHTNKVINCIMAFIV